MPPVFMHSSTMITRAVFFTLSLIVFMSKGFSEMRSITCAPGRAQAHCRYAQYNAPPRNLLAITGAAYALLHQSAMQVHIYLLHNLTCVTHWRRRGPTVLACSMLSLLQLLHGGKIT